MEFCGNDTIVMAYSHLASEHIVVGQLLLDSPLLKVTSTRLP